MPWAKGQSGNPGGRSQAQANIEKLAREYSGEAIEALRDALSDPKTRVQAASVLLDRGFGRPAQDIHATVSIFDRMDDGTAASLLDALEAFASGEIVDDLSTETAH